MSFNILSDVKKKKRLEQSAIFCQNVTALTTNVLVLSTCLEAASCAGTQELPNISWEKKVYYSV
jgi:hypothetical protein